MPGSLQGLVEAAWAALWNSDRPYDLASAIQRRCRVGTGLHTPFESVTFPEPAGLSS